MKKFISLYLLIALLVGVYMGLWGLYAYKGFAYNMGRALAWPLLFFFD